MTLGLKAPPPGFKLLIVKKDTQCFQFEPLCFIVMRLHRYNKAAKAPQSSGNAPAAAGAGAGAGVGAGAGPSR